MTKTFVLDEKKNIKVICDSKGTRNGYKHIAKLYIDSDVVAKVEIEYDNRDDSQVARSWESYEFESVLLKVVEQYRHFSDEDKAKYLDVVRGWGY